MLHFSDAVVLFADEFFGECCFPLVFEVLAGVLGEGEFEGVDFGLQLEDCVLVGLFELQFLEFRSVELGGDLVELLLQFDELLLFVGGDDA